MALPRRLLVLVALFAGTACAGGTPDFAALPDAPREPAGEERTAERVALGRALFWDPVLSGTRDVACATCHHPDFAYTDGRARSAGPGWVGLGPARRPSSQAFPEVARNAPTVLDTAFNGYVDPLLGLPDPLTAPMFWDSRALGLEAQAAGPIAASAEMRANAYPENEAHAVVASRLADIPEYVQLFRAAWGEGEITKERVVASLAVFERTLVRGKSSFDRYLEGDESALTDLQQQGFDAFRRSGCDHCHSGPMLSDYQHHDLGLATSADEGDGSGRFRTPSLRGIRLTAPYFHDGRAATLADVLQTYRAIARRGGRGQANDRALRGLRVDGDDTDAIIAFLASASDGDFDRTVPERVPSGGPVGGNLGR